MEVKSIDTEYNGGNIFNDIIILKDDTIVVITSDAVYFYRSRGDYNNNINEKIINRF